MGGTTIRAATTYCTAWKSHPRKHDTHCRLGNSAEAQMIMETQMWSARYGAAHTQKCRCPHMDAGILHRTAGSWDRKDHRLRRYCSRAHQAESFHRAQLTLSYKVVQSLRTGPLNAVQDLCVKHATTGRNSQRAGPLHACVRRRAGQALLCHNPALLTRGLTDTVID